ncbi:MAG TPA: preprotein translocase subunit YajC [Geobacteraceae bacterium]|nr:preprotein translocase subunit YajC [Geobacteraceae bacterium]
MFGLAFAVDPLTSSQAAAPSGFQSFLNSGAPMFVIVIGIFYFLLYRPQQKKIKEHRALLESLKKGDTAVTAGGIYGKVTALDENIVTLEIATGVNIKIKKGHVSEVIKKD